MKKVDMYFKKRAYGSHTQHCYSYATCENLSTADAKSSRNELRRTLTCSTWLGLAFTRFRYLTDLQEANKCNSCFVTISNILQVKYCCLADR